MNNKIIASKTFVRFGGVPLLNTFWGKNRLTVLTYHRITDHTSPAFIDYRPVVSATPAAFADQLTFVANHFNVIRLKDLRAALNGGPPLPDYPLLITFDDGYLDNYEQAYPLLQANNLPATIFLTTDGMDHPDRPFWWDEIARIFHATPHTSANLPLIGTADLSPGAKARTLDHLLGALKRIPERGRQDAVRQIRDTLGAHSPADTPLFASWEQVREMVANGFELGGHTRSHPILTRISEDAVREEVTASRVRIHEQTGVTVTAFAYPNGTHEDYTSAILRALQTAGYDLAFTLEPGPMRWGDVQAHPLQIRRVYLSHKDTYEVFTAKIMGLPALSSGSAYAAEG